MVDDAPWYALWTLSRCEQMVHDQLAGKGFDVLLPVVHSWRRRRGASSLQPAPMFPGYLFLRHAIDKSSYIQIVSSRGLVRILGERWDRLSPVPAHEIEAIRRVSRSGLPALPYPYLREGQRVRILRGPLADMEGVFVEGNPRSGLLVLSVELLCRSVAVEVECTAVAVA